MKKIEVKNSCTACGLCLSSSYFDEMPNGKAVPNGTGIVNDSDGKKLNSIITDCPVHAIEMSDVIKKDKNTIKSEFEKKLQLFILPLPDKNTMLYEEKYGNFSYPKIVYGDGMYNHSSESSAMSAGRRAIDSAMFSKRKSIIQDIITTYVNDKLTPYISFEKVDSNFYWQANQKAQKILDEIVADSIVANSSINIPIVLRSIEASPDLNKNSINGVGIIKSGIMYCADWIISEHLSDNYTSLSWYADRIDTDDHERWVGTGAFGRDKYKSEYCFKNTGAVLDEIAEDIKKACQSCFNDCVVNQRAYPSVETIIRDYTKQLKDELKEKVDKILALL